jgi:hypothetical protein
MESPPYFPKQSYQNRSGVTKFATTVTTVILLSHYITSPHAHCQDTDYCKLEVCDQLTPLQHGGDRTAVAAGLRPGPQHARCGISVSTQHRESAPADSDTAM